MELNDFISRFNKEFSDFIWEERFDETYFFDKKKILYGYYFLHEFSIECDEKIFSIFDNELPIIDYIRKFLISHPEIDILNSPFSLSGEQHEYTNKEIRDLATEWEDPEETVDISLLDKKTFKYLVEILKNWKIDCDNLRKGDKDEDQLILITDDCYSKYPDIWKYCKFITPEINSNYGKHQLGVISRKDWDFDKLEFREKVLEKIDGLGIIPYNDKYYSTKDEVWLNESYDLDRHLKELNKNYKIPNNYLDILYITDYD
jgi:hypothetical protein